MACNYFLFGCFMYVYFFCVVIPKNNIIFFIPCLCNSRLNTGEAFYLILIEILLFIID